MIQPSDNFEIFPQKFHDPPTLAIGADRTQKGKETLTKSLGTGMEDAILIDCFVVDDKSEERVMIERRGLKGVM